MASDILPARRIGYLRRVPSSSAEARSLNGTVKAMGNKLLSDGLVERSLGGLYRRTSSGDDAVAAFDGSISESNLDLLARVGNGERVRSDAPGLRKMVASGLLGISMIDGHAYATDESRCLVDAGTSSAPGIG